MSLEQTIMENEVNENEVMNFWNGGWYSEQEEQPLENEESEEIRAKMAQCGVMSEQDIMKVCNNEEHYYNEWCKLQNFRKDNRASQNPIDQSLMQYLEVDPGEFWTTGLYHDEPPLPNEDSEEMREKMRKYGVLTEEEIGAECLNQEHGFMERSRLNNFRRYYQTEGPLHGTPTSEIYVLPVENDAIDTWIMEQVEQGNPEYADWAPKDISELMKAEGVMTEEEMFVICNNQEHYAQEREKLDAFRKKYGIPVEDNELSQPPSTPENIESPSVDSPPRKRVCKRKISISMDICKQLF